MRREHTGWRVCLRAVRAVTVALALTAALALGNSGNALAGVDGANSMVDTLGNDIAITLTNTNIQFVAPLDDSMLTREWYHQGLAQIKITGPKAKDFKGSVKMGYQVGYPATFSGQLTFSWQSPNVTLNTGVGQAPGASISLGIPQLGASMAVGNGPGVVDVEAITMGMTGAQGEVGVSNFHGMVTGVIGRTNIRPWVTVMSDNGFRVTAVGPIFHG